MALYRLSPTKFTRYHQKCLDYLESSPEHEHDVLLVHLVKTQRLTEKIHNWASRDEGDEIPGVPRAPIVAYQSAFDVEMNALRRATPPQIADNSKQPGPDTLSQLC